VLRVTTVEQARTRLRGTVHQTPLTPSNTFSRMFGCQVFLKLENLQRTGSFKIRGAANKIAQLTAKEKAKGVIAASAGNHAQGVALASSYAGIPCTIVMPKTASLAKIAATQGYGAEVILEGDGFDEAQTYAMEQAREQGRAYIHAFDDEAVIAGQGTIGLELNEQLPELEAIVVPVGGGGLISGIATALKEIKPSVRVIGVQSAAVPGVLENLRRRTIKEVPRNATVADGIAVARPGDLTIPLIKKYVDDVVAVEEEDITQAMVLFLERSKLVVEGAGAVGLAALLSGKLQAPGKKVVLVLSGGNADTNLLARVIEHGLGHAGRYLTLRVTLSDRPGQLARLLGLLADTGANVLEVSHHRQGIHLALGQAEVEVTLETRDPSHAQEVLAAVKAAGYRAEVVV